MQFSSVDKVIATCSGDKTIKIWSVTDFTCLKTFEGHTNRFTFFLFHLSVSPRTAAAYTHRLTNTQHTLSVCSSCSFSTWACSSCPRAPTASSSYGKRKKKRTTSDRNGASQRHKALAAPGPPLKPRVLCVRRVIKTNECVATFDQGAHPSPTQTRARTYAQADDRLTPFPIPLAQRCCSLPSPPRCFQRMTVPRYGPSL